MNWTESTIGGECKVGDGAHAKVKRQSQGVLYLTCKNFKLGRLDLSKVDYISLEDYKKLFKKTSSALTRPESGDVVFSIIGTLGEPYLYREEDFFGISSSVSLLRPKKQVIPKFLYYWIKSKTFQDALNGIKGGVAQSYVSLDMIRSLPLNFPEQILQKRIASILSNYDDLIDNNNRRIALLEESVHRLYREWFVHLRFPGHERVTVRDGVPEGWEKKPVGDVFETLGGGTPSKKKNEYWQDGDITWYSPTDLTKSNLFFMETSGNQINKLGLQKSSAKLFPPFCVMMTSRATIGAIAVNTTEATTNQGFITCLPNNRVPVYFLRSWLKENVEMFVSLASGATFKEISKGVFRKIEIALPTEQLVHSFESNARTLAEQMLNLQRQSAYLREARDRLLPRLMNGTLTP